jgi:hypothetical protein
MTVSSSASRNQYTATAGQTVFAYTFEIVSDDDIVVLKNGVTLTKTADYTVSGVGTDSGGNVTLTSGATAGDILTLYRDMPYERTTDYTNAGDFLAADVNNDFDRLWIATQQVNEEVNRSIKAPVTDPLTIDMTLPDKADRLGKYLKFNDTTGDPESGDIAGAFTAAGMNVYNFTGDGSTVNFTLGMEPGGENNTQVYIDGVYQQKDTYNLSGAVIQFSAAPPNLSTIEVMVVQVLSVGATTASQVSFTQAGSTTARNVQLKLQELVSVKDFGAVGDGVTDDTAALKAAFDYAIPLGVTVRFNEGTYKISGPIQPYETRTSGDLHILVDGSVNIEVDSGASSFSDVLYLETTNYNSASITGGILFIDGANIAGRGITIRHNDASGGEVYIKASLKLKNFKELGASATRENEALSIYGDYTSVLIEDVYVENVQRTNTGGATKGVAIAQFNGTAVVNNAYIKNVLVPSGSSADADGMAIFGKTLGTTYNKRGGIATVNNATFVDCQGRSFKGQCSNITIYRPKVIRQAYVSITNCVDFDFQLSGQSLLIEPLYEFKKDGSTSPLGTSHSCVVFQQMLDDQENTGKSIGGFLLTEVAVPRYCALIFQSTAKSSFAEVRGLTIEPIGSFATKAIDRAIVEFDASTVVAKSTKTRVCVADCTGPIGTYAIGYTGYTSGSLTSKLSFDITDCNNTLTSSIFQSFSSLSGTKITAVEKFRLKNNNGFKSLMDSGWTFDFNELVPGNFFTVDIANVSATNAPSWGSSGYAFIESLDQWDTENFQHIRVTVGNAASSNNVFFTQGGATPTWGTIK